MQRLKEGAPFLRALCARVGHDEQRVAHALCFSRGAHKNSAAKRRKNAAHGASRGKQVVQTGDIVDATDRAHG
jgi:hypothetical protein